MSHYQAWTCTVRSRDTGRECGGYLGDIWDDVLMIGGREVIEGTFRCAVCKRTSTWHRRRPARKPKVDNNMPAAVQYQQ